VLHQSGLALKLIESRQHPTQNPPPPTMIISKQNRRIIYENLFKGAL
jgi:hypothetical protein